MEPTNFVERISKVLRSCFPILEGGAKYNGKPFDALIAARILAKRAGKDVVGGRA